MSADDLVRVSDDAGVRTLTLHNPERRNAWSVAMEHRYFALLDEADVDSAVRVIVVTGHGTSFCPGMDMEALTASAAAGAVPLGGRRPQTYGLRIRKPIIAAVNGAAAGIGLYQALVCDIRFVSRSARMSTAYARRGTPAEYGMSWLLPRLIGVESALDLLLSARVFDGEEGHRLGLFSRVCDPDAVLADAQAYAADLAVSCSPVSMAAIRRQVWGDLSRRLDDSMLQTLSLQQELATLPDFAEGIASFREKRAPAFPPLDPGFRPPSDRGY